MHRPDSELNAAGPENTIALTIPEAAERLGLTTDAIRMRLKRGTLVGGKVGGRVVVYVDPPGENATIDQTMPESPAPQLPTTTTDPIITAYKTAIARQDDEIAFLREQLHLALREQAAQRERIDAFSRDVCWHVRELTTRIERKARDELRQDVPGANSVRSGREVARHEPPPGIRRSRRWSIVRDLVRRRR